MHRRLWLLLGATLAALLLTAAAGAMSFTANGGAAPSRAATMTAFQRAMAKVPQSQAARKAKKVVVFGAEQDIDGFNTNLSCCSEFWAVVMGNAPVLRGAYIITNKNQYKLDIARKVVATPRSLTYFIRKSARWSNGRHVTAADFIYTWKQFINPKNDVTSRAGYDQITSATTKGPYEVIFHMKKPFADYKDLFIVGSLYPSVELRGQDFNKIWANCVCGSNGKPIGNGPFILQSYTKGQGAVLVKNKYWYGAKPKLNQIVFKIITDTNSEIQSMRGGEVDAIAPSPQTALSQLRRQSGIVYSSINGLYQEHLDLQEGSHGVPIMKKAYFRQAIMLGINRQAIVNSLFGTIAPGLKLLNNLVYYVGTPGYKPDFAKWNYNPRKAIALLKAHCTGGPTTPSAGNNKYWTCGGQPAAFKYTTTLGNHRRETSLAIVQAQLRAIGIKVENGLVPANVMFGPSVLEAGNYQAMEFAWVTSPDPQGFVDIWRCGGPSNYLGYCNKAVSRNLLASQTQLNPAKRRAILQRADALMGNDVPSVPLYSQPSLLIYKSGIKGMGNANNGSSVGPTWNAQNWHW